MKKEDRVSVVNIKDTEINENIEQEEVKTINEPSEEVNIVKSPMVGTFYTKPSPNSAPYVEVGKTVKREIYYV